MARLSGQQSCNYDVLVSRVHQDTLAPEAQEVVGSALFLVGIFCHKSKSQLEGWKDVGDDTVGSRRGTQSMTREVSSALNPVVLTEW